MLIVRGVHLDAHSGISWPGPTPPRPTALVLTSSPKPRLGLPCFCGELVGVIGIGIHHHEAHVGAKRLKDRHACPRRLATVGHVLVQDVLLPPFGAQLGMHLAILAQL